MSRDKAFMPPPRDNTDDAVFDHDNPEWTADDFTRAKPPEEVFGAQELEVLYRAFPKTRGAQKSAIKVPVSIRLTAEVVERFKADGPGWQSRIDEVLKKAVGL